MLVMLVLLLPARGRAQQQAMPPAAPLPWHKAAPALRHAAGTFPAGAYRVLVNDTAVFRHWLGRHLPRARMAAPVPGSTVRTVHALAAGQLPLLLAFPGLHFVDVGSRQAQTEGALQQADLTVNHIAALHRYFPDLTGAGYAVSIKEQPFDTTDIDFKGRILAGPAFRLPPAAHATAMATLVGGAGNTAPSGRGVARQAWLTSADFAELLPDDGAALLAAGVTVQNHAYGVDAIENYYGLEALAYDQQGHRHDRLLHVFSAGNAGQAAPSAGLYAGLVGWANLTGQFKMSKNTLCVGATGADGQVGAGSSRGPAYDGRVKPELVAYGENGTSEAAALVSGIALLVQQAYGGAHHNQLPPAALVKAALINSADDLGRPGVDFETGYGQTDALGAVRTLAEGRFFAGSVAQGQSLALSLLVPAGTKNVKITLVWQDPEAAANAGQALVNDLDLVCAQTAGGRSWQPWVLHAYPHPDSLRLLPRRLADHRNNVEQVTLADPEAGAYTLQVSGYQVPRGPQDFSIAYEFESGLNWAYPTRESVLLPGQRQRLRWQGPATRAAGRLEYRLAPAGPWQLLDPAVPLDAGSYDWLAPDTTGLVQLRLTAGGGTLESEVFLLAPALTLQVANNCAEDFMLAWPAVPGASAYQVYQLGSRYLEPYRQTADTLLVVSKATATATYYALAPVLQGLSGRQSPALHPDRYGGECYVSSFIPRQVVGDTVVFDAQLSTTYQVQSLEWQRLAAGVFQTIQTVAPLASTHLVLTDHQPRPGRNDYRLLLTTRDGRRYLSGTEFVFYTPADFLLVYPNPLAAGQDLQVVLAGSQLTGLVVYDSTGRVAARARESGAIKVLNTAGFKPGIYLLRAQTASGRYATRRLVVQ
jgi:hypothetical protein